LPYAYEVKPKFIQASCVEGKRIDPRQADIVSRYKPDMIFFEYPAPKGNPSLIFNRFALQKKPLLKVQKIKSDLHKAAQKYPYALSDVSVWENIERLWHEGHDVLLFNIDAPQELRRHYHERYGTIPYAKVKNHWWFWAYLLTKERWMTKYIQDILKKHHGKKKVIIAVFLQSDHWERVQFLLRKPSQKAVWKFYFGNFSEITPTTIKQQIKKQDRILYKYWRKSLSKLRG
jgi:hypothetical protein